MNTLQPIPIRDRPGFEETHEFAIERNSVIAGWWNPDIGDILCALCGGCQGWRCPERPISCVAGNPWCG